MKTMTIFGENKKTQFIETMEKLSKTNLSLLNTLNALQNEYERVIEENNKLKLELRKFVKE